MSSQLLRRLSLAVLALAVGCATPAPPPPEPEPPPAEPTPPPAPTRLEVVLEHAEPDAVAESLRTAYEGIDVAVAGRTLAIARGRSSAKLEEARAHALACDEAASRADATSLATGKTTTREVVKHFAQAVGVAPSFKGTGSAQSLDVVAFDRTATAAEGFAVARRLLGLGGVRFQESRSSLTVDESGWTTTDGTVPGMAAVVVPKPRAAEALFELEPELLAKSGTRFADTVQALGALDSGRFYVTGDRGAVVTMLERLRVLERALAREDLAFFVLRVKKKDERDKLAALLRERCEAVAVSGTERLGFVVARERERQAKALAEVTLHPEKKG